MMVKAKGKPHHHLPTSFWVWRATLAGLNGIGIVGLVVLGMRIQNALDRIAKQEGDTADHETRIRAVEANKADKTETARIWTTIYSHGQAKPTP